MFKYLSREFLLARAENRYSSKRHLLLIKLFSFSIFLEFLRFFSVILLASKAQAMLA